MNKNIPKCPGTKEVSDADRKWYVPPGKTAKMETICEECFEKHIVGTPNAHLWTAHQGFLACNCDYGIKQHTFRAGKFLFSVFDAETGKNFPLLGEGMEDDVPYAVVEVPSGAHYGVRVLKVDDMERTYFSVNSGKVGAELVAVRPNVMRFISAQFTGFKEGTSRSFQFVSLSEKDKRAGKTAAGVGCANWLEFSAIRYIRIPAERGVRTLGGSLFDEPLMTMRFGGGASGSGGLFGALPMSEGTTIDGGREVQKTRTEMTHDKFEPIDPPATVRFHLVCTQTEEEKTAANAALMSDDEKQWRARVAEKIAEKKRVRSNFLQQHAEIKEKEAAIKSKLAISEAEIREITASIEKLEKELASDDRTMFMID